MFTFISCDLWADNELILSSFSWAALVFFLYLQRTLCLHIWLHPFLGSGFIFLASSFCLLTVGSWSCNAVFLCFLNSDSSKGGGGERGGFWERHLREPHQEDPVWGQTDQGKSTLIKCEMPDVVFLRSDFDPRRCGFVPDVQGA